MTKTIAFLLSLIAPAAEAQTCPAGECPFDEPISGRLVAGSTVGGVGGSMTRYLDLCTDAAYDAPSRTLTISCQKATTAVGGEATASVARVPIGATRVCPNEPDASRADRRVLEWRGDAATGSCTWAADDTAAAGTGLDAAGVRNQVAEQLGEGADVELAIAGSGATQTLKVGVPRLSDARRRIAAVESVAEALETDTALGTPVNVVVVTANQWYAVGTLKLPAAEAGRNLEVLVTASGIPDAAASIPNATLRALAAGTAGQAVGVTGVQFDNAPGDNNRYWIGIASDGQILFASDTDDTYTITLMDARLEAVGRELEPLQQDPDVPCKVGAIADVKGVLRECLASGDAPNVITGASEARAGGYQGTPDFEWATAEGGPDPVIAHLTKSILDARAGGVPGTIFIRFHAGRFYGDFGLTRDSTRDTVATGDKPATYGYANGSDRVAADVVPLGTSFTASFFLPDTTTALTVHGTETRWENDDRNQVGVLAPARAGSDERWPAAKVPALTGLEAGGSPTDGQRPTYRSAGGGSIVWESPSAAASPSDLAPRSALSAPVPAVGTLENFQGALYEAVAGTGSRSVYHGTLAAGAGSSTWPRAGYVGDATFGWSDTVGDNPIYFFLSKTLAPSSPPGQLVVEVRTSGGLYSETSLERNSGADTATHWAYSRQAGSPGLAVGGSVTAAGAAFSVSFWTDYAKNDPYTVQAIANRWERDDRIEHPSDIAPAALAGSTAQWPPAKVVPGVWPSVSDLPVVSLPGQVVYLDTEDSTHEEDRTARWAAGQGALAATARLVSFPGKAGWSIEAFSPAYTGAAQATVRSKAFLDVPAAEITARPTHVVVYRAGTARARYAVASTAGTTSIDGHHFEIAGFNWDDTPDPAGNQDWYVNLEGGSANGAPYTATYAIGLWSRQGVGTGNAWARVPGIDAGPSPRHARFTPSSPRADWGALGAASSPRSIAAAVAHTIALAAPGSLPDGITVAQGVVTLRDAGAVALSASLHVEAWNTASDAATNGNNSRSRALCYWERAASGGSFVADDASRDADYLRVAKPFYNHGPGETWLAPELDVVAAAGDRLRLRCEAMYKQAQTVQHAVIGGSVSLVQAP